MNTKRLIVLAVGCLMLAGPAYLAAQDDQGQESVADAARKARAERKDAPKAKLTIDNDNLSTLTGPVNVVGESPALAADQTQKPAGDKANAAAGQGEAYWRAKFASAYGKLNSDSHELDIMQREFNLKQQQFYTDPMASLKQEYSRQDINDSRAKIDEMTATVAQDKSNISDLEDQLRQAGGDPGWAVAPTAPASESAPASEPAPASVPAPPTGAAAPPATEPSPETPAPAAEPAPAPAPAPVGF